MISGVPNETVMKPYMDFVPDDLQYGFGLYPLCQTRHLVVPVMASFNRLVIPAKARMREVDAVKSACPQGLNISPKPNRIRRCPR